MKKTKLITVAVLVILIIAVLLTTLVACKKDPDEPIKSGNDPINSGDPGEKDPDDGIWKPPVIVKPDPGDTEKTLTSKEMLNKIIESVEVPEQALNIDISAKAETDNQLTTLALKGNFYSEVRNELCFAVYQQKKGEEDAQKQMVFALYIVNDKIYIDMADGTPLIYLSDFDFNYIVGIIKGAGGMVGDLVGSIDSSISGIIDLVLSILLGEPQVTTYEDGAQAMSMELRLKDILGSVGGLLGFLPFDIPVDLEPIITYIANLIPDQTLYINAKFDKDSNLENVGISGVDKETEHQAFDFAVAIALRETADLDIGIPTNLAEMSMAEFSFTNLKFAIDLVVESQKDENGDYKNFDIGSLINSFLGTSTTMRIPEGLLLLNGGTGIRLAFTLDLDLNYDKLPVDNNKIAIELYLINPDGTLAESEPQIGIYYKDGSFYLNTDNMLPNYLNGLNIKLDASLVDVVDMLVDLVTDAIDGVFGLDFAGLRKGELQVNDNGSLTLSSMSAVQKVMSTTSASVVALATESDGSYKLSAGIGNFVDAVAKLLGLGGKVEDGEVVIEPNIFTTDTSIKVVVNNAFFESLSGLIPQLKDIKLPDAIGDIVLSINTSQVGLDSITVDAALNNITQEPGPNNTSVTVVDPALGIRLSLGQFLIGFKDENLSSYIDSKVNTNVNYLDTFNSVIDLLLGGIRFSSGFTLNFDKGTYDFAPFIAGFGVPEVEASQILWTFDNDFQLDASLNLQIALNKTDTAKSMIVLEMKTESCIKVGEHQIIEPDKVLLGIYGYNNNIYIDISNFNIAGIVLPKLSFSLNFTDLVYTLLDNFMGDLLKQIGMQSGDSKFELNFKDLFGLTSSVVAQSAEEQSVSSAGSSTFAQARDIDATSAIILAVTTEKFVPTISLAAILAILNAANTDLGNTLAEALSLMEIDLSMEMGRKDGFTFSFSGDFIPKVDGNGDSVYYFDDKGELIVKEEGKIYRNIKDKPTNSENVSANVVYYTTKKYNYGSNMKLVFSAGTPQNPVIVGNLGAHKYPIEQKAQEFTDYKSDLIEAILGTVGKGSILLDIDLVTLDNEMNLTRLINNIMANFGQKLELPMSLDLDDWKAHVQLALAWDLDLTKFSNSKIKLEMTYEQKVIMGVYINRNSIIVDLTGLGLFSGEIVNSTIVSKVFTMIDGVIKNIGNLDLNDIINDLLEGAGLPTVGATPEETDKLALSEEVATDGTVATIGEGLEIKDFVQYLTQAIHLENTAIVLNATSALINGMLNDLVGLNLGLNLGLHGTLDVFGDKFNIGMQVEDITLDLTLSLSMGKDVEIPIDFDEVPDWDASSGTQFVTTLLNNLDIGFTIDLANYTNDVVNLHGATKYEYIDDYKMYTRIVIEKVTASSGKKLTGVDGTPTAPQGSFVVTLAHINKSMYNDNSSANTNAKSHPLVYIVLDHRKTSGQMDLYLCANLVTFGVIDIGNAVGKQSIDLDLVGMLAPMIDNLFASIDSAFGGGSDNTDPNPDPTPTPTPDPTPEEPTGISKVFADLDIIKLLGEKGIMLNLRANGTFNVTIEFDPYLINKLIDDIMGWVFAGGTDHGSIIDLSTMEMNGSQMFSADYLSKITWTREKYGAKDKSGTFWGDLRTQLDPMLKDIIKAVGYGGLSGLTALIPESVFNQVRQIVSGILPFAVWNSAVLEVNVVDATISNIHFRGQDEFDHIYAPDGSIAYKYDTSVNDARGSWRDASDVNEMGFFTEIFIYNSSKSVGQSTADGSNNGIVTWADIPTNLTFMPYIYSSYDEGVATLAADYFTDKTAIYQKGNTIMRADVKFSIVDSRGYTMEMNPTNLAARLREAAANPDKTKRNFTIYADATFSGNITKRLEITVDSRDEGGGLDYIEDIEMHAYDDELPDFLTVHTKDGESRKINTEYLDISGWRPREYTAHDVEATAVFKNGTSLKFTIHYLDSTVDKIIIDGSEGTSVNVNLYEFDLNFSKIEDFTPSTLFFKYPDGKAVGLDVLNGWDTAQAQNNLFNRALDVVGEDGNKYSSNLSGGRFTISTYIAAFDGAAPQKVELTFVVQTKKVYSLTINDAVNTINIDPYKYYMYMIGESEENPFPSVVEANYFEEYANPNYNPNLDVSESNSKTIRDEYDEDVHVVWKNLENVVFDWDNNNDIINRVDISLDNSAYPNSTFTWTFTQTQVAVLRNEVQRIYFDKELTQTALFIDPFQYLINGKGTKNFPDHAYVQFTNGAVYYMPIAWKGLDDFVINPSRPQQFRQFDVVIGFDPVAYNKNPNDIVEYSGINGNLLQEIYVNVQVEDRIPQGIMVDGSELVGGTYYIDPVQVLYYGMDAFPSQVTVKYMSGKTSILEVSDANWERNFEITMRGKKGLVATLRLNDEVSFDINVEIIERGNLKADLTNMSMDPYIYTMDERGNRIYDVYADNMNLYQSVGTIDLETFEIVGRKQSSGPISAEHNTFLRYVLNYEIAGEENTLVETDIDYIKDFIANNVDITIISAEVLEYFNVPITWDLTEINYSVADTYPIKVTVMAANPSANKEYKVLVEVRAKKVEEIVGEVQYIMVGGTNLSETAKLTQKLTLNKLVKFDDGTEGTYEITLDLTKISYSDTRSATLRWEMVDDQLVITDLKNQRVISEDEVADCAMNVEVTVCSGDIAQKCTMKVHVLDNQTV